MKINFLFEIDEEVITPFNEPGIITMLGVDEGGNKYYVQTKSNDACLKKR